MRPRGRADGALWLADDALWLGDDKSYIVIHMRRCYRPGWPQRGGGTRHKGGAIGIEYLSFDFDVWFADQVQDQPVPTFGKTGRQIVKNIVEP